MLRSLRMAAVIAAAIGVCPAWANEAAEAPVADSAAVAAETVDGESAPAAGAAAAASSASASDAVPAKPAAPAPLPNPTLTVSIDLAQQRMTVSEHGAAMYSWAISSGTSSHPTPRGTFRPQWAAKMWYSRKYDWAPMPHAVFINGGVAVHGTQHVGALGRPASHGCIRLAPGNARTFYNLVHRHGLKRTKVAVHGSPKQRAPAVASRRKKPAAEYADNGAWFWGSSPSTSAYNPSFVKKRRAPAPQLRAYRKRGTNQIVYVQQPPANYVGGW